MSQSEYTKLKLKKGLNNRKVNVTVSGVSTAGPEEKVQILLSEDWQREINEREEVSLKVVL